MIEHYMFDMCIGATEILNVHENIWGDVKAAQILYAVS